MNAQHTPTPWHVGDGKAARIIYGQDGYAIADATVYHGRHGGAEEANAAFIVRAVNAHDDLVAALRKARNAISEEVLAAGDEDHPTIARHARIIDEIDAALAKAGAA